MNRSFPFLIAAFLLCSASGEELLNRSFQTEESLKDITSKLPGTHSLVTLEDGKKALELRIPETAEQRRNVLIWRGKGKDFRRSGTAASSPSGGHVRTGKPGSGKTANTSVSGKKTGRRIPLSAAFRTISSRFS